MNDAHDKKGNVAPKWGALPVVLLLTIALVQILSPDLAPTQIGINSPPIAEAGPDSNARVGDIIVFNGSLSYDPDLSGSWTKMTPMPTPRRGAGVASYGNLVYVMGGAKSIDPYWGIWKPYSVNEVYDVKNDSWSTRAPMPTPRDLVSAVRVGDRIYVIGGNRNNSDLDTNEEYDITNDSWTTKAPSPGAAHFWGLGVVDGKIYGVTASATFAYDPERDSWQTLSGPPEALRDMGVASLNGMVYAFGGEEHRNPSVLAYAYDPSTDSWSSLPNFTTPRAELAAISLGGRLFAVGGEEKVGSNTVTGANEMYDFSTGLWTSKSPLPTPRDELAIAAVGDAFYVIGGSGEGWFDIYDCNERYSVALSYDWDYGDGSSHSHGETTEHSYSTSGNYTVTLQVTDAEGATGVDTLIVTIMSSNQAPVANAGGPYVGFEGIGMRFDGSSSFDPDGESLHFRWDFQSDGMWDTSWSASPFANNTWGDDWKGRTALQVSDNILTSVAITNVTILNLPPLLDSNVTATATGVLTLRIAGEKWHDIIATIYRNGVEVYNGKVVRTPGSPDDQAATLGDVTFNLLGGDIWSAKVVYTPENDPINGQPNGADPAWIIFRSEHGNESSLHHTFNVQHNETWTWDISDLRTLLVGIPFDFKTTATDPGSDDLTIAWDWGDGTPITSTTHFNDGVGFDQYPSPDGTFPFTAADTQTHAYTMAGTYSLKLTVRDDDGGVSGLFVVVVII